jgi:flagellin
MTVSSINTNAAAIAAQQNISNANAATADEVAALSSGNRIVQASDDVAALSVGTALASQISTLNTSLTVASQGSSLLQVADGALAQIQSILQQQQSIATQAQSGSLSSTQLGFLNEEFQSLTQQIDQLAGSTNFNGVSLINGGIAGGASITTNTSDQHSLTPLTGAPLFTFSQTTAAANTDSVTINGVTVTFTTAAAGTSAATGEVSITTAAASSTTAQSDAANLVAFLNSSGDPQFANLTFSAAGGVVSATYTGGALAGTVSISTAASSTGITAAATTVSIVGTTSAKDGLGLDAYSAVGQITGNILATGGDLANNQGEGIDVSQLADNAGFIGQFGGANISNISAQYDNSAGTVTLSLTAGGINYSSGAVNLISSGNQVAVTFTGTDSNGVATGGSFSLLINGSAIPTGGLSSQDQANSVATTINNALSGVSIYQNRAISSFTNGGTAQLSNGEVTANLKGAELDLHSNTYSSLQISNVQVTAPSVGQTNASISLQIGGETYNSVGNIGDQFKTGQIVTLQSSTNSANTVSLVLGGTAIPGTTNVAADVSTSANAAALQTALSSALGISASNAALTFQVGSTTSDTIGVSIGSATSSSLFGGQTLDVSSQADASTASNVLGTALDTVSALRANVGALEQRFTYASNAITSAAQNEGAAKSTLLDTDVASESTLFATSQVQLQAGIAVLAQANQLQQNLLKLIA